MTDTNEKVVPLDPREGPTAYVKLTMTDTLEEGHARFISGVDPDNPTKTVLLNKREALLAAREIQDYFDE